jgi:hypothetical protein
MDWWPFTPSEFYGGLLGAPDTGTTARRNDAESVRPPFWGPQEPSALDASLLQIVYESIAAETTCSRCRARLGRRLRVEVWPTLLGSALWRVAVRTRCRGWRRHRHTASVGRESNDLVLGPFRGRAW